MTELANPGLDLLGYLITMFNARKSIHKMYEETLRTQYGDAVFATRVPHAAEFPEAIALPQADRPVQAEGGGRQGDQGPGRRTARAARRPAQSDRGGRLMSKLDELRRGAAATPPRAWGPGSPADRRWRARRSRSAGARYKDLAKTKNAFEVPVDKIVPDPNQPRKVFTPEDLQDLADSIRGRGLLQPIRVRWDEEREKYVIVAGERRWRAAIMAGKATITCVVVEGEMTEAEILHDQLVENCLRADLQPIEQAEAFKTLMDAKGWSAARLAEELHIRDSTVFKALALLELPGEVRERVAAGEIKPATAYELSQLDRPRTRSRWPSGSSPRS